MSILTQAIESIEQHDVFELFNENLSTEEELLDVSIAEQEFILSLDELNDEFNNTENIETSFEFIDSVINSVEKYGWSKSLIYYIDPNNEYQSKNIIPSIESIDDDEKSSTEGILDILKKIKDTILKRIYKMIFAFKNVFRKALNLFQKNKSIIEKYVYKKLINVKSSEDLNPTKVDAYNVKVMKVLNKEGFDALSASYKEFLSLDKIKILANIQEEFFKYVQKIGSENVADLMKDFQKKSVSLFNKLGMKVREENLELTNKIELKQLYKVKWEKKPFKEYSNKTKDIIDFGKKYVDEYRKHIDALKSNIKNIDNLLQFLLTVKIPTSTSVERKLALKMAINVSKNMSLYMKYSSSIRKDFDKCLINFLIAIDRCKK